MNLVWLSANKLGYELLKEALKVKGAEVSAIVTLSDKAKTVMYDGIEKNKWKESGVPVYEVDNINKNKDLLKKLAPDLIFVVGWRQIINKDILDIPKKGVIGFHPTLLPIGRGPAPIINSILKNFKTSGVTMFYLSEGLDDGDIVGQERFDIQPLDHATEVYEKVIEGGKELISKYLPLLIKGKAPRIAQDDSKASIFEKPSLKDNKIDFDKDGLEQIHRKIRALSKPYRGTYIEKDGKKLVLWRSELEIEK